MKSFDITFRQYWQIKAYPRCAGDLYLDNEYDLLSVACCRLGVETKSKGKGDMLFNTSHNSLLHVLYPYKGGYIA